MLVVFLRNGGTNASVIKKPIGVYRTKLKYGILIAISYVLLLRFSYVPI